MRTTTVSCGRRWLSWRSWNGCWIWNNNNDQTFSHCQYSTSETILRNTVFSDRVYLDHRKWHYCFSTHCKNGITGVHNTCRSPGEFCYTCEHAPLGFTLEVSDAGHRPVVLTHRFIQHDTRPFPRSELRLAYERDLSWKKYWNCNEQHFSSKHFSPLSGTSVQPCFSACFVLFFWFFWFFLRGLNTTNWLFQSV